jgi:chemotaxis signal transduction protein
MIASADRPAKGGGSVRLSPMALSQTDEQCSLMRNLGTLAVAVPEIRTLSKDQFLPAPTSTGEGVFALCVAVVKLEDRLRGVLETAALLSHFEGTG